MFGNRPQILHQEVFSETTLQNSGGCRKSERVVATSRSTELIARGQYIGLLEDTFLIPHPNSIAKGIEPPWVGEVIIFWFEELGESGWFKKRNATDERI